MRKDLEKAYGIRNWLRIEDSGTMVLHSTPYRMQMQIKHQGECDFHKTKINQIKIKEKIPTSNQLFIKKRPVAEATMFECVE